MTFRLDICGTASQVRPTCDEKHVTGSLACPVCSFTFNDYVVVQGIRIPNVRREVVGKNREGYIDSSAAHVHVPWIDAFWS